MLTAHIMPSLGDTIRESQIWKSIFRHPMPVDRRNRIVVMLTNFFLHLHPVSIKKQGIALSYTWCMGGVTFFLFLVETVTGVLLMFYYRPTLEWAYNDILALRDVTSLGILREIHRWGAHAMVITVWLHMYRVFLTGSYKPPREFNWVVGVILLLLTLLLSFTGYLLPWDQLAIWAITVGSNMARATPVLGHEGPAAAAADGRRRRHDHQRLRRALRAARRPRSSAKRRSTGFTSCTASRFRWRWRCCWRSTSGGCARTAASAGRFEGEGRGSRSEERERTFGRHSPLDSSILTPRHMHGLTDAQFLSKVASLSGARTTLRWPLMNGVAALLSVAHGPGEDVVQHSAWRRSVDCRSPTRLAGCCCRSCSCCLAPLAASGNGAWMPSMPEAWRDAINRSTGPVVYSAGTVVMLVILFIVPPVLRAAGGGLDHPEPDAAVPRPVDDRPRLLRRSSPSRTTCRS